MDFLTRQFARMPVEGDKGIVGFAQSAELIKIAGGVRVVERSHVLRFRNHMMKAAGLVAPFQLDPLSPLGRVGNQLSRVRYLNRLLKFHGG